MGAGLHTNCVSIGAGLHTNCVSNVSMGAGHHTSCVSMGAGHLCNVNIITLATLSPTPIRPSLAVVAAFNQEKALVGAFSVITNLRMELGWNFLKH